MAELRFRGIELADADYWQVVEVTKPAPIISRIALQFDCRGYGQFTTSEK
jgi:hypothetical protein